MYEILKITREIWNMVKQNDGKTGIFFVTIEQRTMPSKGESRVAFKQRESKP